MINHEFMNNASKTQNMKHQGKLASVRLPQLQIVTKVKKINALYIWFVHVCVGDLHAFCCLDRKN